MANLAAQHVWKDYEFLAGFDTHKSERVVDPDTAKAITAAIKQRDAARSCGYFSILAQCNSPAKVEQFLRTFPAWGPILPDQFDTFMHTVSRKFSTTLRVFDLEEVSDSIYRLSRQPRTFTSGSRISNSWSFLYVGPEVNGEGDTHLLPLVWADLDYEVLITPEIRARALGAPRSVGPDLGPVQEASSTSVPEAVVAPRPAPSPQVKRETETQPSLSPHWRSFGLNNLQGLNVVARRQRLGVEVENVSWTATCRRPSDGSSPPPLDYSRDALGGLALLWQAGMASPTDERPVQEPPAPEWPPVAYEGVWPPPPGALVWRGGWWPSTRPPNTENPSLLRRDPEIVSATLQMAGRYADSVLYLPLPEGFKGVSVVGNRTVADLAGATSDSFFLSGDVVQVWGVSFRAETVSQYGVSLIKLSVAEELGVFGSFAQSVGGFLRGKLNARLMGWTAADGDRVLPCSVPQLDEQTVRKAEWTHRMGIAPPECLPVLTTIRREAYTADFGETAPRADSAALYAVQQAAVLGKRPFGLAAGTKCGRANGSYFAWGDCYSCGGKLPGKRMPGRLCGCVANPTRAARAVADGLHVAPHGGVVYPGVVECPTRHPPLKKGKATLASSSVFRCPPPVLSSPDSSPMRAVARGSEGLA